MGKIRLIEYLWFIYGLLEGYMVYFMDCKQDLRLAWSTVWKAAQKTPWEGFSMHFLFFFFFFFVFYGSIKAITEAIYRWFHFSSTASV